MPSPPPSPAAHAGEWITVDDLFATMRRRRETSPTVARSERGLWKLYLVDPPYGRLGYSGPILECRYTLAVLFDTYLRSSSPIFVY